jgi:hypothetical protein
MRLAALAAVLLALGACTFSSSSPPPPAHDTVVVPSDRAQ